MNIYILGVVFILILLIWIFLVLKFSKKTKLSEERIKFFNTQLKRIITNSSPKEQIIDMDKLYHKFLQELWYEGTFWEILKLNPEEIPDINKIWELHKLRNKLVHDFDLLSEKVLKSKSAEYNKEINKLIKQHK